MPIWARRVPLGKAAPCRCLARSEALRCCPSLDLHPRFLKQRSHGCCRFNSSRWMLHTNEDCMGYDADSCSIHPHSYPTGSLGSRRAWASALPHHEVSPCLSLGGHCHVILGCAFLARCWWYS